MELAWDAHGVEQIASFGKRFRSKYGSGRRAIANGFHSEVPDLADHDAVLEFLLSHAPPYSIVYPTENFYYYRFQDRDGQWVWGNLRLADANAGYLGLTYFHPGSASFEHKTFISGEGIQIEAAGNREYKVTYKGTSTTFFIPEVVKQAPSVFTLLDEERYVGRIVDESAVRFHLLFNTATNSFYTALDDSSGVADTSLKASDTIKVLERSGFAFYDDAESNRKILVGVPLKDIAENNYFDGPGDQVPYELEIRDMLYLAYPHTMIENGLDEHGVFLGTKQWQRVAITPYVRYSHLDEVNEIVHRGLAHEDRGRRWTDMTTEWWNTPFWAATQIRRLHEDGKSLLGRPTGLLTLEELIQQYPSELSFLATQPVSDIVELPSDSSDELQQDLVKGTK